MWFLRFAGNSTTKWSWRWSLRRRGRFIPEDAVMDHVAGYTILNDVSDREYSGQKDSHRLINWFFMKGQDTFAPWDPVWC